MKEKILIIGGNQETLRRVAKISADTGKEIVVIEDPRELKNTREICDMQLSKMELKNLSLTQLSETLHGDYTNPNSRSNRRKKLKPKRIKNKRL
jgi:siroheme synthase (precorrin-2 oxidase/ferrochelatase)